GSVIALQYSYGLFDDPKHVQIATIPATGGQPVELTKALDRNCRPYPPMREPIWMGSDLLFAMEDHGNTHLYRVAVDGSRQPETVIAGELAVTGYDAAAGSVVHTATNPRSLSELYAGGRQLTRVGKSFIEAREFSTPERFVAASPDGAKVDAWIMRPVGFAPQNKYPLLLNIHGGAFTPYGHKSFFEFPHVHAPRLDVG